MNYIEERNTTQKPVDITIHTRVPSKWRFIDLETGDFWSWNGKRFVAVTLMQLLKDIFSSK